MKFISFFLLFFTFTSILASPVAVPTSDLIVRRDAAGLDVVLKECAAEVKGVCDEYKKICATTCSSKHITDWSNKISKICYKYIEICKAKFPPGSKWGGKAEIIAEILAAILIDINNCLKFLASKAGLLGLIVVLVGLVGGLITALNALLACISVYVAGLLVLVGALLFKVLGLLGCILCSLGLVLT